MNVRAFRLSVCAYVRMYVCPSEDEVNVFGQCRISRPINGSKLICHIRIYLFETSRNIQSHDLMTYISWSTDFVHVYFGQIIKVKIFVQGRISRPTNGSKLIFHMRMYLYETSRNIQEP